jgi:photosystem II stability/assembly factor-like uncharacterized protein
MIRKVVVCLAVALALAAVLPLYAQNVADITPMLHWRSIGPLRASRTRALCGVASQPNVFYTAQVNGGVWKTTDAGRTWFPIFDDQPTGSIGAIGVSQSNPNVIYVGSGEGLHRPDLSVGDGIYKSTDAGKTWTHLEGLRDAQQIAELIVDPKDPNMILVAAGGHPYGPSEERGVYRSADGGKTFTRVLGSGPDIGAYDVIFDPTNSKIAYASTWDARDGAWENGSFNGTDAGIFKSVDGGRTWKKLTNGLPPMTLASIAVAPSRPQRLTAAVHTPTTTQFYQTDNGGDSWTLLKTDERPTQRIAMGDLGDIQYDPKNADTVYVSSIVTWKSTDNGKTWTGFRGAPGGDDYQQIWINPNNPDIIAISSDQGAIITVNGGQSFSSWYNQPTAQMYHVNADNAFPYRLCSGQQESGSACVSSRGDYGEITMREWTPVDAEEYGYVVPDPLAPDVIYGGKLTRFDRRTGQAVNILPQAFRGPDWRMLRTEPIIFSPVDSKSLFFAGNTMWKTMDGGNNWTQVSPDLTRKTWDIPATVGKYKDQAKATQRGVIYTIAPSYQDIDRIWAGTDDGLIHVTSDGGKNWKDITPPMLQAWAKVSIIDAGRFDKDTAYAAINTLRLDDNRPHILRTHDAGRTWTEIVNGIPGGQTINVVREDPVRKGLLYAGSERQVYVSFDDGDHWQSLRANMPATSIRDLIIKGDDLAVGTHGRGFWILDDITPIRQLAASRDTHLYEPQTAWRVRFNLNSDTPLPPDEASQENPPDGASIDYYLAGNARDVALEIRDASGRVVRTYRNTDKLPEIKDIGNWPAYWLRRPQALSAAAGAHRFLWDMHYQPIPGVPPDYPIAANYMNTAPVPTAPWAHPGKYKAVLRVDGKEYTQNFEVRMDPRVRATDEDLKKQFDLSMALYELRMRFEPANAQIAGLATQLQTAKKTAIPAVASQIDAFLAKLSTVTGAPGGGRRGGGGGQLSFGINDRIAQIFGTLQEGDYAPTTVTETAARDLIKQGGDTLAAWDTLLKNDLPQMQTIFRQNKLPELKLMAIELKHRYPQDKDEDDDDPRTEP